MIFKQIDEILSGRKTQTRRVMKFESEIGVAAWWLDTGNNKQDTHYCEVRTILWRGGRRVASRSKWFVGRTYAIAPGRGKPGVWWKEYQGEGALWFRGPCLPVDAQPLRIRITDIRAQRLQDISEEDARAEGVNSVEEYKVLWESINNKKPGARWADNPWAWVLTFERVEA